MKTAKAQFKSRESHWIFYVILALATVAVYSEVLNHSFLNYDDLTYVTANEQIKTGLRWEGVQWAFTTFHEATWHPLTWLSHMLDCQLFGVDPGKHHLVNLLLHTLNTLFLFAVLRKMTGKLWPSGVVAALFALHPLHVESVAWVAERKDLLSTLFWILTLWAYHSYVKRPVAKYYLLSLLFFALGLMSKPMLVTLPFVLLLLDYWPLKRFNYNESGSDQRKSRRSYYLGIIWEKIPFLFFSAALCLITVLFQQKAHSVAAFDTVALDVRISNALESYVNYIGKMFWPVDLAVLYPHTLTASAWKMAVYGALLLACSLAAFYWIKRFPWFFVGWFFYLGTLVPVIGLVQVGVQSGADRYTYIPLIGLFIIITWSGLYYAEKKKKGITATALSLLISICLVLLSIITFNQVKRWANSVTLFEHTIEVTENNWVAHYNLGLALASQNRIQDAVFHYKESLRIRPEQPSVHNNLGLLLGRQGKNERAIQHFEEALQLNPNHYSAHNNMGVVLCNMGKVDEARSHFQEALRIKPDFQDAKRNLMIVNSETAP